MSGRTIEEMADEVAALLGDRLQVRGVGLAQKLRRGGRALPRALRREAQYLVEAAQLEKIPKLRPRIDQDRVAAAHKACVGHLRPLGLSSRRLTVILNIAAGVGLAVVATAALVIAVMVWRGYL